MKKLNKNNALREFADAVKRQESPEVVEKDGELYLYSEKLKNFRVDESYKTPIEQMDVKDNLINVNFLSKKRANK